MLDVTLNGGVEGAGGRPGAHEGATVIGAQVGACVVGGVGGVVGAGVVFPAATHTHSVFKQLVHGDSVPGSIQSSVLVEYTFAEPVCTSHE